jgi:hypothetical protein
LWIKKSAAISLARDARGANGAVDRSTVGAPVTAALSWGNRTVSHGMFITVWWAYARTS